MWPPAQPKQEQIWFEGKLPRSRDQFHYRSGHKPGQFYVPEIMVVASDCWITTTTACWMFIVVQGGRYIRNKLIPGNKTLQERRWLAIEELPTRGCGGNGEYGLWAALRRYNGDGWMDIYCDELGRNTLYRNNGDGNFLPM